MTIKLKQIILGSVAFLLVGCASEPMINISEENQSIINKKLEAQNGDSTESTTEDNGSELTDSASTESASTAEEVVDNSNMLTTFDTSSWSPLEVATQLPLTDYLPNVSYQIKQFSNGVNARVDYPNFVDDVLQMEQVESRLDDELVFDFYKWDTTQVTHLTESADLSPYINHLQTVNAQGTTESDVLLQAPLQVGTAWQRNASTESAITAIFSQASLPAGELTNVIEVTSTTGSNGLVEYYAQGEGLVATVESDASGAITQVWQVEAIYHDNRIINNIEVMLPTRDEAMVETATATFKWQTNGNYASAFDEMFKELGIIDETITVNSVAVENNVVMLDFTPGVVAVLSSYDAPEQAVIASIVTTLGNFFNEEQVRLSVSGSGMLPDTIGYPTNGIYQVSTVTQVMSTVESSNESDASSQSDESRATDESTVPMTSGSIQ